MFKLLAGSIMFSRTFENILERPIKMFEKILEVPMMLAGEAYRLVLGGVGVRGPNRQVEGRVVCPPIAGQEIYLYHYQHGRVRV